MKLMMRTGRESIHTQAAPGGIARRRGRPRLDPAPAAGRGLTLPELLFVLAIATAVVVVVLPVLAQAGWEARKTACSRTLDLAFKGLSQYADANRGAFPTCGYGPGTRRFDVIGCHLTRPLLVASSNSRNLFLAVRLRFVQPAALICPNTEDIPPSLNSGAETCHDFNVGNGSGYVNRLSYSYHLQFTDRGARCRGYPLTRGSHGLMAVLADRTPLVSYSGKTCGDGTVAGACGVPPGNDAARANSFNHEQEGQNVVFVAGHVTWSAAPTAGVDGDNIYTVWDGQDRAGGSISLESMPQGRTDSFLVP